MSGIAPKTHPLTSLLPLVTKYSDFFPVVYDGATFECELRTSTMHDLPQVKAFQSEIMELAPAVMSRYWDFCNFESSCSCCDVKSREILRVFKVLCRTLVVCINGGASIKSVGDRAPKPDLNSWMNRFALDRFLASLESKSDVVFAEEIEGDDAVLLSIGFFLDLSDAQIAARLEWQYEEHQGDFKRMTPKERRVWFIFSLLPTTDSGCHFLLSHLIAQPCMSDTVLGTPVSVVDDMIQQELNSVAFKKTADPCPNTRLESDTIRIFVPLSVPVKAQKKRRRQAQNSTGAKEPLAKKSLMK